MPSLSQVLARLRKASRQSRPTSLRVPALILRRVTWHRMSFSEPLVCSGVSGRSKHHQQLVFVGMQSCQQAVERDEAGAAQKDAVEPGAQRDRPAQAWLELVSLQAGIEVPNQAADPRLRG